VIFANVVGLSVTASALCAESQWRKRMKVKMGSGAARLDVHFTFELVPETEFERDFLSNVPSRSFNYWRDGQDDGGGELTTASLLCLREVEADGE